MYRLKKGLNAVSLVTNGIFKKDVDYKESDLKGNDKELIEKYFDVLPEKSVGSKRSKA